MLSDCPLKVIEEETFDVIRFAKLYRKGLPPVAGGALDQAGIFIDAAEFVWAEETRNKIDLKIRSSVEF